MLSEAKQTLVNIARDQQQYPKILEGLIAQVPQFAPWIELTPIEIMGLNTILASGK